MGILESLTNNAKDTANAYIQMIKDVPGNLQNFAKDPVNYLGGAAQNFSKQMQDPMTAATSFGPNPLMMRGMVIPAMGKQAGRATRLSPVDAVPEFDISNLGARAKDPVRKPLRNELWEQEYNKISPQAQRDFMKKYFPYWGTDDAAYAAGNEWIANGPREIPGKPLTAGEIMHWPEYFEITPQSANTPIFPWEGRLPEGAWEHNPQTGRTFMGLTYNPDLQQLAPKGPRIHELGHEVSYRQGRQSPPIENVDLRTVSDYLGYLTNPDEMRQFISGMYHNTSEPMLPGKPYDLYNKLLKQLIESQGTKNLHQAPNLNTSMIISDLLHGRVDPRSTLQQWGDSYNQWAKSPAK